MVILSVIHPYLQELVGQHNLKELTGLNGLVVVILLQYIMVLAQILYQEYQEDVMLVLHLLLQLLHQLLQLQHQLPQHLVQHQQQLLQQHLVQHQQQPQVQLLLLLLQLPLPHHLHHHIVSWLIILVDQLQKLLVQ